VAVGILADFVVATPEDALEYGTLMRQGSPVPPDRILRAEYRDFTNLEVEVLWAILRDEEWDAERHGLEQVLPGDGEEWLFHFPDELVHLISALDEAAIEDVADVWGRDEEVSSNRDELMPVLRDLKKLAVQARQRHRGLYLWGSL
jgi:hypothetical protein